MRPVSFGRLIHKISPSVPAPERQKLERFLNTLPDPVPGYDVTVNWWKNVPFHYNGDPNDASAEKFWFRAKWGYLSQPTIDNRTYGLDAFSIPANSHHPGLFAPEIQKNLTLAARKVTLQA